LADRWGEALHADYGHNRLKMIDGLTSPENVVEGNGTKVTVGGVSDPKAVMNRLSDGLHVSWGRKRAVASRSLNPRARLGLPLSPLVGEIHSLCLRQGVQLEVVP
jgi:hypothetical protein